MYGAALQRFAILVSVFTGILYLGEIALGEGRSGVLLIVLLFALLIGVIGLGIEFSSAGSE